jgi:polyhydroxyalkanoate synthesis regulator phasin
MSVNFQFSIPKILLFGLIFLIIPCFVSADELLEERDFFVDTEYDLENREEITAVLQRVSDSIYFYLEKSWWDDLEIEKRKEVNIALSELSTAFEETIYPVLTSEYGEEWKPGIDLDKRITVLIHPMEDTVSGYFRSADEYPQAQVENSNQREMVYLAASRITDSLNKSYLAHEFTHLITFNQKERAYGIVEETWLNEARAEYAPTLLGYDDTYEGSNLQKRVRNFLNNSRDSLTEWQGRAADYGILNLFTQYLVDQYGKEILADSLHSNKTGVESLNYALGRNGFSEDFSQVFTNWTIAIFINECEAGPKYCYLNDNLENIKVPPFIYYLPTAGESTLSVGYLTRDWAGNWQKIIGGKENLKLEFNTSAKVKFRVPYIVEDFKGNYSVNFLGMDNSQKGTIFIEDGDVASLTIIPSIQEKTSGFSENEPEYHFYWSASSESATDNEGQSEEEEIEQLKARIEQLKAQIAKLQAMIAAILAQQGSCTTFTNNLYYGMMQNPEVRCLQQFLKSQGEGIYPEGLVTGNFLSLTKQAVIRFQEKYREEILDPIGLKEGTGFVGNKTRVKINGLISQ